MRQKIIVTFLSSLSIAALLQGCSVLSNSDDGLNVLFSKADKGWLAFSDYDRGKHYIAVGDCGLAIEAFNAALARDPKSVDAINGLAIAYDRIGRADVARNLFAKALELDPKSPDTLNNLAYLHLSHGEKEEAALYFSRAKEVLATASVSDASAKLKTVVDNNRALLSGQTEASAVESPNSSTFSAQAPQQRLVQSVAPASPATSRIAETATQQPAMAQPVVAEIWNLRINGPEPKLIPPPAAPVIDASAIATPQRKVAEAAGADIANRERAVKHPPLALVPPPVASGEKVARTLRDPAQGESVASPVWRGAFQNHVAIRIANGTGRRNMASRFQHYFDKFGVPVRHLVNASIGGWHQSTIYYSRGQEGAAKSLAKLLPISVQTVGLSNNYDVVELMLGSDLVAFDTTLIPGPSS